MGFGARRGKLDDAFAKLHRVTGQQTDRRSETGAKRREHPMTECPGLGNALASMTYGTCFVSGSGERRAR